jgi:hypothetical protein
LKDFTLNALVQGPELIAELPRDDDGSKLFRGIINGLALEILVFGALWLMLR